MEGMPEESSLTTSNPDPLFDGLMSEKLSIKEALEGIDDKTLNGLVQAVETKVDTNPTAILSPPITNSNTDVTQHQSHKSSSNHPLNATFGHPSKGSIK